MTELKAVIFDLDGVLTDTIELHYLGWQRLADEEGLAFSRAKNDLLRGMPRHRSLELILEGREVKPEHFNEMLERKNRYHHEILRHLSDEHLLPGIGPLLEQLQKAGIRLAVGSASKNVHRTLEALDIADCFDVIGDGHSVEQPKPAPDIFLFVAREMGVKQNECVVIEDATSGIDAALTGGFATIGIGPEERVGHAHLRFDKTSSLTLEALHEAVHRADNWHVYKTQGLPT